MSKVLFVPLNTNHVLIMKDVIDVLPCQYDILCHDRIAGNKVYHTEKALKKNKLRFFHLPRELQRNEGDNILRQLIDYLRMKAILLEVFEHKAPQVVVLAVDNDPISYLFLKIAKRKGIKTAILQEASARPDAKRRVYGAEGYIKELLRFFGVQLSYTLHGTSNLFSKYMVSGPTSKEIMLKRGVPESKIIITGQPKYDSFINEAVDNRRFERDIPVLLFAAGPGNSIIADEESRLFLIELIRSTSKLCIKLVIKLHPRSPLTPADIKKVLNKIDLTQCEIIKKGDETISLLKKSYGLITVASTVVTEALILDREGIIIDYLAKKEQKLPYRKYNAVHYINSRKDIYKCIEESRIDKKPFENKKKLLEDMLHYIDGKAANRVAKEIMELL